MKTRLKAALAVLLVLTLALTAACDLLTQVGSASPGTSGPAAVSSPGTAEKQSPSAGSGNPGNGAGLDPDFPPLTGPPAVPIVLMPSASGERVEQNDKAVIDYSNTAEGYVMIKWLAGAVDKGLRVLIEGTGETYTYTLNAGGEYEVYPLSDGNGTYTVKVVNLLEDGRGSVALSLSLTASLTDEFAPFLRPNQYVNFSENSKTVMKAAELVTAESDFIEKVSAIYRFVITNITYDVDLANEIIAGQHQGYLPVIDDVLEKRKGICFDFAAVMAAMLRSQGIPTKLVVGIVNGDTNHAWLNVYSEEEGWIDAIIYFDGGDWEMMDPTFASSGSSEELKKFIGDGSYYVERRLY